MYRSLGALVKLIPGAAYRVNDRLSVGATLGLGVSHAELAGPFTIQTGPLAGAPTILSVHATGTQLVWSAGLQYQLTDCTTIGASYISETRVRMDGEASATVFGLGPPVNSEFNSDIQLTWPRSVGVGVKHDMGDRHTLAMDLIWFNWSQAFDNVGLTLDNASNPALSAFMPYDDVFALEWRDTLSVRTGYEFWANDNNVFRMGYVYHRNPIPERTLTTYIPAILEHAFSAGWGTMWRGYHVDLAYQYSFGRSRRVGTSDIVGGDFSNSRTESQAHWAVITLTHTY